MYWFLNMFSNYANFKGRAGCEEFWTVLAISFLISLSGIVTGGILSVVYILVVAIPSWALMVRRMHDIGRSGWWALLWLIPVVGWVIILFMACFKGKEEPNKWGVTARKPDKQALDNS